jgi:predicted nuclease of predicted toxin-antitoxin system
VKFLVDAQLPRRLSRQLNDSGHDAIHTLDLPERNATTDDEVARIADSDERIVMRKDKDFRDSHLLRRTPRKLLLVTTGNIRNADLLALFDQHLDSIERAFAEANLVELDADGLTVHSRRQD